MIIIGDMGVGKTSIVQRFVKDHFDSNYKATIGVDFEIEQFKILSLPFNIQIWDTAGQERFRCIASAYYRGAHAIILTFSLIDAETLASTKRWLKDVLEVSKRNDSMPLIFLVGTKKDLLVNGYIYTSFELISITSLFSKDSTSELNVQRAETEAVEFARQINAEYWPISSLTGQNVNEFFFRMTSVLFNRSINDELDQQYMKTLRRTIGGPGSDIKPTGKNSKCLY